MAAVPESPPLELHLDPAVRMSEDQFFEFCQQNRDIRIERTAEGDLLVMPPVGGHTGARESEIGFQLAAWAKQDKTGVAFSASTGFRLSNGATRSPDAAWISKERLAALTPKQYERFLPLCPEFLIELRSPSDSLEILLEKMREYLANGARLGWLIDPVELKVWVFRPDSEPEIRTHPENIDGAPLLPGFVLDLREIW